MKLNVRSKFNLHGLCGGKLLVLVSLLFMVAIVFPLYSEVNGWVGVPTDATVETEAELVNAINAAPDNEWYYLVVLKSIVLEKSLEIPNGKQIYLTWYGPEVCLIGANGVDTIVVKSGGSLGIVGCIVVTHAEGEVGRGVFVERGGTFSILGAVISGNSADKGGGVYNEGTFDLSSDESRRGVIANNTATLGGGVYNVGTFKTQGEIYGNNATDTLTTIGMGGGVYNEGTFTMASGYIQYNIATKGGGVYDAGTFDRWDDAQLYQNTATSGEGHNVFTEETNDSLVYLLSIVGVVVAVVVVAVVGLFFYRVRRRKPLMVNNGCVLCFDWRATYEKT